MITRARMTAVVLGLLCLLAGGQTVVAADEPPDQIVLRSKDKGGRIAIRCHIVNYTAKLLTFRMTFDGELKTRPSSMIIDVKTPQSKPHVQGLIEFTRNRYAEAQIEFEKALPLEDREWVRRELLALLVRCALKRGDFQSACTRFVLLVKSDPETRHMNLLPLVWGPRDLKNELKSKARSWVNETRPAVQLIGASILMSDARFQGTAEAALVRLMRSNPQSMRDLARMQLWRKRIQRANLDGRDLVDWQTQIDRLDESLRGGPYFLLGSGHLQRRESEQAAAAFLWLPLVYDHDHHLAARACLEAADALSDVGRNVEAAGLFREVVTRFGDTPFAQEAKAQLKKLKSPKKPGEPKASATGVPQNRK